MWDIRITNECTRRTAYVSVDRRIVNAAVIVGPSLAFTAAHTFTIIKLQKLR